VKPARQIAKLVWIYKPKGRLRPVDKTCCRAGIMGVGRCPEPRQCSRQVAGARQHEGSELGMCTQHGVAWDAYQATKRTPKS
jgi:hypothetical protein